MFVGYEIEDNYKEYVEKLETLIIITEEAQKIDPNGTHDEVIKEIEEGTLAVDQMIEYYREVLKQWLEDSCGDNKIARMLEMLEMLGE